MPYNTDKPDDLSLGYLEESIMTREIEFDIDSIDKIWVQSDTFQGWYNGKRLFAGYEGENEATELSFTFGSEFDGYTINLIMDVGGDVTILAGETGDFDYEIPTSFMVAEAIRMVIRATLGTQVFLSEEIILEVKR